MSNRNVFTAQIILENEAASGYIVVCLKRLAREIDEGTAPLPKGSIVHYGTTILYDTRVSKVALPPGGDASITSARGSARWPT